MPFACYPAPTDGRGENEAGGAFEAKVREVVLTGFGAIDDGHTSAVALGDQWEAWRLD